MVYELSLGIYNLQSGAKILETSSETPFPPKTMLLQRYQTTFFAE